MRLLQNHPETPVKPRLIPVQTATVMTGMVAIGLVGMLIDILIRQIETALRSRRGLEA